jgi:hypothetical protein
MTENHFSVNITVKKQETVIQSMKESYRFYLGLCAVIIAALLLLAIPAAAMGMAPGADSCSSSGFHSVSGQNMQLEKVKDCKKDCYHLCAVSCNDGWCMLVCMNNCDRYCKEIQSVPSCAPA